ncbi:Peptidyl-tRNA hydrolase ArfB [Dyadobacter sp. CECT 9275]|uniref:Peptidyl-tRNA hydrolase ArfB n=1 Tax=Dyadobacter helix TaxID=2822344 RepID=A0A916JFB3_9BACT|nr:alternative ribosome rescue aminoacyl-tRNA hydrolase ArfB [Dyadobacter sp. CECT 9275]CAG5006425.1 Peptidyl-tRNA hydrolase ArfB [Dyadobacter sp. CECT 9275]
MIDPQILHSELSFQTARSGGSGGQNVNKVESKVELRFDIPNSAILTEDQKQILYERIPSRLTNDKILILYHQTERSQYANKEKVIEKFDRMISQAFIVPKNRKPTKPTLASKLQRLQEKQRKGMVKSMRKRPLPE